MSYSVIYVLFLCLFVFTEQLSTPQDDSYVAAVVEYEVQSNVTINIENYVNLIEEAAAQNADIVVFPEMTLTRGARHVDIPIHSLVKDYPVPAAYPELYDEILVRISEAALINKIYVVINVQEQMDCRSVDATGEYCPEEKVYLFNTNVVFDRTGAVIDRYRKINLFGEFTRTPALQPDLGIFTTDFGVTFGHYICFDLMFQVPAIQVVEKHNLTDIIFTTMWFSELPYLTAVQIQEAYAYAMNVNFLASGANNVRVGSAGSGIYSGKAGALISIMPGLPTTRVLVAKVPKIPGQVVDKQPGPIYDNPTDHDNLVLISDPSLPSHISRPLINGYQDFTLVDKEISCRFRVRLSQRDGETVPYYRAFVFEGSNKYAKRKIAVGLCLVVACRNEDVTSCPYRYNQTDFVDIQELEIEMTSHRMQYNNTLNCDNIVYFPSSFRTNKFPLDSSNFTYIDTQRNAESTIESKQDGARTHFLYKLNAPQNEIVSFGIWERIYTKDVDQTGHVTEEDVNKYINIENVIYGINEQSDNKL